MLDNTSKGKSLGVSRRAFVAWAGALGAGAALAGCSSQAGSGSASGSASAAASDASASAEASASSEAAESVVDGELFTYDKEVWGACHVNCGSRCPLKLFVKDGEVVRVTGDVEGEDEFAPGGIYQMRSCARGRTNRQRIYNETRVEKPLKRVEGTKRGEGKYEEIEWDQAISEIADIMKGIKDEYGNDAFYIQYGTGQIGGTIEKSWAPDDTMLARMMNCWDGYLRQYCDYSTGQITWELPLLTGDAWSNNEVTDWYNSKNIVLFGNNPANTRMSGSAMWNLITNVRLNNPDAQIVVVDPHLTDTAIGVGNTWLPIRPGTDPALVAGMIQYLYSEGKLDESLIRDKFVGFYSDSFEADVEAAEPPSNMFFGFDATKSLKPDQDMSYEAYLNGTGYYDGTGVKTPEWAAEICGIPADKIRWLADIYMDGPTATVQGWGPQRHSNGGNVSRSIGLIAAITGNVGISGGGTGARESTGGCGYAVATAIPNLGDKNTVENCISFFEWYRAIEDYQGMRDDTWGIRRYDADGNLVWAETPGEIKLKAPIKFIWNYASNVMGGQHADINDCLRIYNLPDEKDSGLRCVVTVDCYMTPTAMMSDYILPGTTSFEETDITSGGTGWTGWVLCEQPAIEPMFEAKPIYEICSLIAEQLGVADEFTEGKSQEDWVEWCYDQGVAAGDDIPATFDEFKEQQLFKQCDSHEPSVYDNSELATPSGKYEIFSKQAYNISQQWDPTCAGYVPDDGMNEITPLPIWNVSFESYGDEETRAEYPFQLIGHHYKARTHSSYGNVDWMKSVAPQELWINRQDAADLGVSHGDEVIVTTKRGRVKVPAKVTDRIMPGVVSLPQGAWYRPETRDAEKLGDASVLDTGGCISVLTSQRPTPISMGNGVHSNLCKIEKA